MWHAVTNSLWPVSHAPVRRMSRNVCALSGKLLDLLDGFSATIAVAVKGMQHALHHIFATRHAVCKRQAGLCSSSEVVLCSWTR